MIREIEGHGSELFLSKLVRVQVREVMQGVSLCFEAQCRSGGPEAGMLDLWRQFRAWCMGVRLIVWSGVSRVGDLYRKGTIPQSRDSEAGSRRVDKKRKFFYFYLVIEISVVKISINGVLFRWGRF